MAIMNKIILASAAFAAFANAAPMEARGVADMVTQTTWTTVDVDVTVWVDQNGNPYSTETGTPFAQAATTSTAAAASATSTDSATSAPAPSAGSSSPSASQPAGSFYQAPTPSTTAAPVVTTTPAPVAPSSTTQAQAAPPASSAPAQSSSSSSSYGAGSDSGTCEGSGNLCEGDITHYDGGLGACGDNINTDSDMTIALPANMMSSGVWPDPLCGKMVTIVNPNTGNTIQAKVADKCPGCSGRSIDLTNAVFNAIGGGCDGRCHGFKWFFSS